MRIVFIALILVASFTDAWIETHSRSKRRLLRMSHLLQMRGLKPINEYGYETLRKVASFTDAWIETGLDVPPELKVGRIFYRCVD